MSSSCATRLRENCDQVVGCTVERVAYTIPTRARESRNQHPATSHRTHRTLTSLDSISSAKRKGLQDPKGGEHRLRLLGTRFLITSDHLRPSQILSHLKSCQCGTTPPHPRTQIIPDRHLNARTNHPRSPLAGASRVSVFVICPSISYFPPVPSPRVSRWGS